MKMTKVSVIVVVLAWATLTTSCGKKELQNENMNLVSEVDSLSTVLTESQTAWQALAEIGELLDTIEFQRDIIRIEMVESGISYDDYVGRIENLNNFLASAQSKITELEKSQYSFTTLIKKLKKELADKDRQVEALESILDDYEADNVSMQGTIRLQQNEIDDLELEIVIKEQELALIEAKIDLMIETAQITEADGYYARAVAYEEAANRTKLAPRKKKETLRQALELYEQSLAMGNENAQAKIEELKAKVN